jgi:hypothetical protein
MMTSNWLVDVSDDRYTTTRGEQANHYATDAVFNYAPLIQNNMDDLNSHEHFKPTQQYN